MNNQMVFDILTYYFCGIGKAQVFHARGQRAAFEIVRTLEAFDTATVVVKRRKAAQAFDRGPESAYKWLRAVKKRLDRLDPQCPCTTT